VADVDLAHPEAVVVEVLAREPQYRDALPVVIHLDSVDVLVFVFVLDLDREPAAELVVPVLEEHTRVGGAAVLIGPGCGEWFLDARAGGGAVAEHLIETFSGEVLPFLVVVALAARTTAATAISTTATHV